MTRPDHPQETIIDYISGCRKPNIGAEANRQDLERFLIQSAGYAKQDIEVDAPIAIDMGEEMYTSSIDLVVSVRGKRFMVIKCAPGSLGSREREVIAAARLLEAYQIPLAVASDGQSAMVWDTISGKKIGQGLDAIPSKAQAEEIFDPTQLTCLEASRRSRQKLIFRSYDSMNVHVGTVRCLSHQE